MPSLFGESTSTTPSRHNMASSAPSFGTKRQPATSHPSLSDRLTPLLISAGLVRGTTPRSVRKQLGARIRDTVFYALDGDAAEQPKAACSSTNGH